MAVGILGWTIPLGTPGYATTGYSTSANEVDFIPCTLQSTKTISSIKCGIFSAVSNASFRYGVYSDNAGVPDTLLGYTVDYSGDTTANSIVELSLTTPLTLSAGRYWLAYHCGTTVVQPVLYDDPNSLASRYKSGQTFANGLLASIGLTTSYTHMFNMWAEYIVDDRYEYTAFGLSTVTNTVFPSSINELSASLFTLSSNKTITSLSVEAKDRLIEGKFKLAIYSSSSGLPATLLAQTDEIVTDINIGTITIPLTAPIDLTAGDYWLAMFNGKSHNRIGEDGLTHSTGIYTVFSTQTYADGFPTTFPTSSQRPYSLAFTANGYAIPAQTQILYAQALLSPPAAAQSQILYAQALLTQDPTLSQLYAQVLIESYPTVSQLYAQALVDTSEAEVVQSMPMMMIIT